MRLFFSLFILALIAVSCNFGTEQIRGNGQIISQIRQVSPFTNVKVSGAIKVHVRQEIAPGVRLESDSNLLQYIEVSVNGNTLEIHEKKGVDLDPTKEMIAYVSAPVFRDIQVSGACDIVGETALLGDYELSMHVSGSGDISMQVNLPKVSTEISGSGSVSLNGRVNEFTAAVSGSGDVKCFGLDTDNTLLDLSGSANAEVSVNKQLKVEASGASTVKYKGNASVSQNISGSGKVEKVS
jgi:hypothetical protein